MKCSIKAKQNVGKMENITLIPILRVKENFENDDDIWVDEINYKLQQK